ncbi:MAG: hypothetical protein LC792_08150 [Actinobacteria bacterium]|nr:hypothetical protein [Actinomycetota bacterium]
MGWATCGREVTVFNRLTTLTGGNDIDAALQYLEKTALPVTRSQAGYQGAGASVDRAAGILSILTMWDSAASREASESAIAKNRDEASRLFSGNVTVELFEDVNVDMAKPPIVGASLRVVRYRTDPATLDDFVAFFDSDLVPRIKAMAGFRALRNMVNRETGAGIVGSSWDDDSAMQQADGQLRSLREDVGWRGVSFGETSQRQIALTDMP